MSGPKVSSYTLSPEQRKRLDEERRKQLEAEKLRIGLEQEEQRLRKSFREDSQRLAKARSSIQSDIADAESLLLSAGEAWQAMKQILVAQRQLVDDTPITTFQSRIQSMKAKYRSPGSQTVANESACKAELVAIRQQHSELMHSIAAMRQAINENSRKSARTEYERWLSKQTSGTQAPTEHPESDRDEIASKYEAVAVELEQILLDLPDCLRELGENARQRLQVLSSQFTHSKDEQRRRLHDFELLVMDDLKKQHKLWMASDPYRQELAALYALLDQPLPDDLESLSASELRKRVDELNRVIEARQTREYIEQAVAKCMSEMGYPFVARNTTRFSRELLYRVHDDTVMHVSLMSDGQIAMEIGLAAEQDRPLDTVEMTRLVDDMGVFCKDYPRMQQKLRDMGVVLRRDISLLPPSSEHARIIELSAFNEVHVEEGLAQRDDTSEPGYQYLRTDGY